MIVKCRLEDARKTGRMAESVEKTNHIKNE